MPDFIRNLEILPQNNFPRLQRIHTFWGVLFLVLWRILMRKCLSIFFPFIMCLYFMLITQFLWCSCWSTNERHSLLNFNPALPSPNCMSLSKTLISLLQIREGFAHLPNRDVKRINLLKAWRFKQKAKHFY